MVVVNLAADLLANGKGMTGSALSTSLQKVIPAEVRGRVCTGKGWLKRLMQQTTKIVVDPDGVSGDPKYVLADEKTASKKASNKASVEASEKATPKAKPQAKPKVKTKAKAAPKASSNKARSTTPEKATPKAKAKAKESGKKGPTWSLSMGLN
eukprot:TRINITY_DN23900_c0_g1_i1.p1 TRINITY_DN23900_c0_g1~~TRINITY_DN23900_c0_g1_i1.p1  ORF type:complete len:153 (-),score=30.87 TRINITY_DN23900_c0_g1_i1:3-461(-)